MVLLFLDATEGITRLDKQLADYIAKEHRPCIFTINKWDLMVNDIADPSQGNMARFANLVQYSFPIDELHADRFHHGPDRQERQGPDQYVAIPVQAVRNGGSGTGTLNRILQEAVLAHAPATRDNRTPRIYYATQVGTAPPTIVLFVKQHAVI